MLKCEINSSLSKFAQLTNLFVNIVNSWNNCSKYYTSMSKNYKELTKLLDHIHKCHLHPYIKSHDVSEYPNDFGIRSGCTHISCIDRLVRELMEVFDTDDNNLIYGKHFIFHPNDPDVPQNIKENQIQYEIRYERLKDVFMSFEQYFSHFNVLRRCIPKNPTTKLLLQLILGENPDSPDSAYNSSIKDDGNPKYVPCSNKTYGKDFIIDPEDPDKPKELIDIEKRLSIDDSVKKIKYSQYLQECIDKTGKGLIDLEQDNEDEIKIPQCDYVCTRLVAEWLHTVDIDGNGMIYGKDFKICDTDPMKCRCLQELEQDLDWNEPSNIMTWEQFCKTFPDNNPDDRHKQ